MSPEPVDHALSTRTTEGGDHGQLTPYGRIGHTWLAVEGAGRMMAGAHRWLLNQPGR